ncbi:hypothetical protein [Mycolicibacterium vaccae]|uniref:hypothetical protein n=1 Tax=Mycolicibacterium vaccae TaxID=1810 RepID=UPI003D0608E1
MTIRLLTAAGTWAPWMVGYPADIGRAIGGEWEPVLAEVLGDEPRFRWRPIDYPAVGFLNPDPNTSYDESVAAGVAEGLRILGEEFGPLPDVRYTVDQLDDLTLDDLKALDADGVGYSQGAEVIIRIAVELARHGLRFRRIVNLGSPCRVPGPTRVGNNPPGSGIARLFPPKCLLPTITDIVRNTGEMYGCALDDTYLPEFYALFVQAEVSIPFAAAALQWAMPYIAGGLGAVLSGNPFGVIKVVDLPKAVKTAGQLIDFASTQAHTSYHLPAPEFGGRTGIQVAIDTIAA